MRTGREEERVREQIARVRALAPDAEESAWRRLDALTKPPRSLGRLEEVAARISAVQGAPRPSARPATILVFAADHGVTAEGVSAYPQSVTREMVRNLAAGGAAVCVLARHFGVEVVVTDVGVAGDTEGVQGLVRRPVRRGTANIARGPAMTREEACAALNVGIETAAAAVRGGSRLIGTGEMGIGNTTSAAAVLAALTGAPSEAVVGPGTGVSGEALAHKGAVVARAIEVNRPSASDPIGLLAALGGLEIAAMAGAVIGAAAEGVCVVIDGFISSVAALVAARLCPECLSYMLASHRSAEPGHGVALEALDLSPLLDLEMRLGEGTGAVLAMAVAGAACAMMSEMATFDEAGVSGPVA